MNRTKIISAFLLVLALIFNACKPTVLDKPGVNTPPTTDQLSFEITPGDDDFTFVLTNTSSIVGIAHWDLGNGVKVTGNEVEATYSFPGEYVITLTLVTNGGQASIKDSLTQTKTDYSLLTDPVYVNLCGGVDSVNGKTWVLDSMSQGHLGVGPADGTWPEWWSCAPLGKQGTHVIYDDQINFNIMDFVVTYNNHDFSYVKDFRKDDPAYSNPAQVDGDYIVSYPGPIQGTWTITSANDVNYIVLNGNTPVFPCFDVGAVGGSYEIQSLSENELKLKTIGGDGNAWYYILIPKGYERPVISFDFTATATGNPNEYNFELINVDVPSNTSIVSIEWDYSDPLSPDNYSTSDTDEVVTHTYMAAGTYTVTATITDVDGGEFVVSHDVVVANDHPDYTPYIESGMNLYTDFESVFRPIKIDPADGTATMELISNPFITLVNGSDYVMKFTKTGQWPNIYIPLSDAYRFDFSQSTKFKLKVFGNAGDTVLLKVENTDLGADAWTTGAEVKYGIQESNTWEVAVFDFAGVGTAQGQSNDITTDPTYSSGYYNVVRVMINPGDNSAEFSVLLDDWAGPTVPGWKKSK